MEEFHLELVVEHDLEIRKKLIEVVKGGYRSSSTTPASRLLAGEYRRGC